MTEHSNNSSQSHRQTYFVNPMFELQDCAFKPYRSCHEIDSFGRLNMGCCGTMLTEEPGQIHMTP